MNSSLGGHRDYATADLALAAALVCCGHKLKDVDRTTPRRIQFIFEKTDSLLGDIEDIWGGILKVKPMEYFTSLKMLKNRIYQGGV